MGDGHEDLDGPRCVVGWPLYSCAYGLSQVFSEVVVSFINRFSVIHVDLVHEGKKTSLAVSKIMKNEVAHG